MKTNNLWSTKAECCGCELCSHACPQAIISMKQDEEGFLYPHITDDTRCVECKQCIRVCPMKKMGRSAVPIIKGYGGFVKKSADLRKSASGGYATAVSYSFISELKGVVYGVKYSNDYLDVLYSRAERVEELEQFRTSKYVQASKENIYRSVKADLKQSRNVLFIGLPCEVSALYNYIGKDTEHLYTASLICHGPTSIKVHQAYCNDLIKRYSSNIKFFSLRYKLKGWKPYYLHSEFDNGKVHNEEYALSDYGIAFQYLKRPSCSVCKYKYGNLKFGLVSDLTFGDFHAVSKDSYMYNPFGVSEVLVHSTKGKYLFDIVSDLIFAQELSTRMITIGNIALYEAIPQKKNRALFVTLMNEKSLHRACRKWQIKLPTLKKIYRAKIVKLASRICK